MEHEPDPEHEHRSGKAGSLDAASHGLSFQSAPEGSDRTTGHCYAQTQHRDLRARLLLASAQGLQRRQPSEDTNGMVAEQIEWKCFTRPSKSIGTPEGGLAGADGMGMRNGKTGET